MSHFPRLSESSESELGVFKINSNFSDDVGSNTLLGLASEMDTGVQIVPKTILTSVFGHFLFFRSGIVESPNQFYFLSFEEILFCTAASLLYILTNNTMIVGMGQEGRRGKF